MADQWHYRVAGENKGPVSSSELKQLASAAQLSRTDLIWKDGMANWAPAGKVKGLFPVQETVAPAQIPPLPPPLRTQGGVTPPINLFTSKDAVGDFKKNMTSGFSSIKQGWAKGIGSKIGVVIGILIGIGIPVWAAWKIHSILG